MDLIQCCFDFVVKKTYLDNKEGIGHTNEWERFFKNFHQLTSVDASIEFV